MTTFEEHLATVHGGVVQAIEDKDPELFASFYAEVSVLLPPDGRRVLGRGAISEEFGNWLTAGFISQTLENVELTVGDTMAVELGIAVGGFADGSKARSNYVVVHTRQDDGSWLMQCDIWTRAGDAVAGGASY